MSKPIELSASLGSVSFIDSVSKFSFVNEKIYYNWLKKHIFSQLCIHSMVLLHSIRYYDCLSAYLQSKFVNSSPNPFWAPICLSTSRKRTWTLSAIPHSIIEWATPALLHPLVQQLRLFAGLVRLGKSVRSLLPLATGQSGQQLELRLETAWLWLSFVVREVRDATIHITLSPVKAQSWRCILLVFCDVGQGSQQLHHHLTEQVVQPHSWTGPVVY